MFNTVGLVVRQDKKEALKLADEIAKYLISKKIDVFLEDTLKGKINTITKVVSLKDMRADFIITIGGDGTILRTCLAIPKPEPPILGINMGVRGFLTEVEPKNAITAIDRILKDDFRVEKCAKLRAVVNGKPIPDALNDVVIAGKEPSKVVYIQIFKDDKPVLQCEADGLIVATQTGSTGYSLSAGGPVLDPEVDAMVLTPICSLTVFRSMVLPASCKVKIEATRLKDMVVLVDGNFRLPIPSKKASMTVCRAPTSSSFIRFKDEFYDHLQNRLLFKGPR
ncbi:MAG: NAD(+) kinase [Crenarchaeota archaeon]|nr:NAD(+) kinase [Thermoproteota archaeon]